MAALHPKLERQTGRYKELQLTWAENHKLKLLEEAVPTRKTKAVNGELLDDHSVDKFKSLKPQGSQS